MSAWALVLGLALSGTAAANTEDYPIAAVRATLRVEPGRTVVDIASDSIYWIFEVLGQPPQRSDAWPPKAREAAERYINDHFHLAFDGHVARGRLLSVEWVQHPWNTNEEGTLYFRVEYPPTPAGAKISGDATFFGEFLKERLAEGQKVLANQDFRTRLRVPGAAAHEFDLTPQAPTFSLPETDARRTAAALAGESFWGGLTAGIARASSWPAIVALSLTLAPGFPGRKRAVILAGALALGAAIPLASPTWLAWAAAAAAAAAAGRWMPTATPALEAAGAAALGRLWAAAPSLPGAAPAVWERALAALGALTTAAAVLTVGVAVASAERRRLEAESQSRAAELFDRRRAFAATAILVAAGYGLFFGGNG